MAAEITFSAYTGQTLYAQQVTLLGQVWNTSTGATETSNPANWASYVIPVAEPLPGQGMYVGSISPLPAGTWLIPIYLQNGSAPASSDALLASYPQDGNTPPAVGGLMFVLDWSGSAVNSFAVFRSGSKMGQMNLPEPQFSLIFWQTRWNTLQAALTTLIANPYTSVNVDGQMYTAQSLTTLQNQVAEAEKKCALYSGRRNRVQRFWLSNAFG
jgi:hypothetical protein